MFRNTFEEGVGSVRDATAMGSVVQAPLCELEDKSTEKVSGLFISIQYQ